MLNIRSGISAWAGSVDALSLQRMAPYIERVEKGEPISLVLPTLSNGKLDPSLDLTRSDVDFIRQYYGTPKGRKELHQELTESIGKLLAEAASTRAESESIARHPAVQALAKAFHEGRYLDAAKIAKTYPIGIVAQVGAEGLPGMLPGLAASAIDPALGAAIFAGSDSATAYGNALLDSLAVQGIDVTDGEAVQKALGDPEVRKTATSYAKSHAAGAAALALVTGGGGGKIMGEAAHAVTKTMRKEIASAAEDGVTSTAKEGEVVDSLKAAKGNVGTTAKDSDNVASPQVRPIDPSVQKSLKELQANIMTEAQVSRLPGPRRGIVYIKETLRGNKAAQEHQRATEGHIDAPEEGWAHTPVLRYDNPNPRGKPFVKLDVARDSSGDMNVVLVDAKTKLALFHSAARTTTAKTLERVRKALEQNPGYELIYEFASEEAAEDARQFIAQARLTHLIAIVVRKKP